MTPYRPSNGSEGEYFMAKYCEHCKHDAKHRRTDDAQYGCKIIVYSFAYNIDDPNYPKEWVYADDGAPTCTKFAPPVKRKYRGKGRNKGTMEMKL